MCKCYGALVFRYLSVVPEGSECCRWWWVPVLEGVSVPASRIEPEWFWIQSRFNQLIWEERRSEGRRSAERRGEEIGGEEREERR